MNHQEPHLPDDLGDIADMLRAERPELDALTLDRIKLQAMSGARRTSRRRLGYSVRPRLAALLTAGFVAVGSGGAFAFAGDGFKFTDLGKGKGSAGFSQYKPPCPPGEHPKFKHKKFVCVPNKGKGLGGYGTAPPPPKHGVEGYKKYKPPKHKHHKK
jgi:hypothetical protein